MLPNSACPFRPCLVARLSDERGRAHAVGQDDQDIDVAHHVVAVRRRRVDIAVARTNAWAPVMALSSAKQVKIGVKVGATRAMATMTTTRRLAAILAADVVGYSRLMGADEEGTPRRVKAHLVELVDPKIREHHGRIVKTTGDGVLAEFASVVDAVRCGGEIQRAMAGRDLDLADERRIRLRIGINLGDVIADGGDIYGDSVNIAVRLEGLAAPSGICVSGTVRDHIGDRLPSPSRTWESRA